MAWYNGGNWEGLGAAHLAHIIHAIIHAMAQRNAALFGNYIFGGLSLGGETWTSSSTVEDVAEYIGAINSDMMIEMIEDMRNAIASAGIGNYQFVSEESGDDIWSLFDAVTFDEWSPVEGDANFYALNATIWNQMREALDTKLYARIRAGFEGDDTSTLYRGGATLAAMAADTGTRITDGLANAAQAQVIMAQSVGDPITGYFSFDETEAAGKDLGTAGVVTRAAIVDIQGDSNTAVTINAGGATFVIDGFTDLPPAFGPQGDISGVFNADGTGTLEVFIVGGVSAAQVGHAHVGAYYWLDISGELDDQT